MLIAPIDLVKVSYEYSRQLTKSADDAKTIRSPRENFNSRYEYLIILRKQSSFFPTTSVISSPIITSPLRTL